MSAVRHEFLQSPTSVRAGELVTYGFDTTPWGAGASAAVVSAINLRTGADLTSTISPAATPSINGAGFYTLPQATGWVVGVTVRITAQFNVGADRYRPYCDVSVVP